MDVIWSICDLIVLMFELSAFAIIVVMVCGFIFNDVHDVKYVGKLYEVLFEYEPDDED